MPRVTRPRPPQTAAAGVLKWSAMIDKDIEAKIDDLAQMVARGFTEVRGEMKELRDNTATTPTSQTCGSNSKRI